jgi:hypothetical protein
MPNEVEGTALVCILAELFLKLLDPVLSAEIYTGGDRLTHPLGIIHFGGCQQKDLVFTPSGLGSSQGHLFSDPGNIGRNFTHFACSLSGEKCYIQYSVYSIPQWEENFQS